MEERFFLDGVQLQRPDVSMRNVERSSLIEPDPADPVAALANEAPVPAGKTADLAVRKALIKLPFLHMLIQNLFQRYRLSHLT